MSDQRIENIITAIRDVPDFPKKGIIFKDITTLLKDKQSFADAIDLMLEKINGQDIDAIASIESRGFIFGAILANRLGVSFIPIRKPGKLPYKSISEKYELEYGFDQVEMHADAIKPGEKVLIVDDLLATGGTARASCQLVEKLGGSVLGTLFLIELSFLSGRKILERYKIDSVIKY
jgi:adenine phosphoribosyltransferase